MPSENTNLLIEKQMSNISASAFSDTKAHYDLLDGLRGVAALMVIWYHVFEGFAFASNSAIETLNHGYLAVDFFFILSGFVIGYAYDDRWGKSLTMKDFFKRRLIRLHPMVIMGAVLGAVSPAVVVPRMVQLMDSKYGTEKSIPQLVMAGASCDDIFVIVLFTTFVSMAQGGHVNIMDFVNIPISMILGILLGAVVGYVLSIFFETAYAHKHCVRNSMKVIIILGVSFMLMAIETWTEGFVSISGLLAIVSMACILKMKSIAFVSKRLSEKFGKLWIAAEVILFVLVGAAVDIRYTMEAGLTAIAMIFLALLFRGIGVSVCLVKTQLNWKERLFCVIAYLPKATVQAAIGSIPLAMGLPCGQIVLSVAVLAILVTAPLGAIGIDLTYKKLLIREGASDHE